MLGTILWVIVVVLVVIWLLGWLAFHITSPLIHLLLVIAVIVLAYNLIVGRREIVACRSVLPCQQENHERVRVREIAGASEDNQGELIRHSDQLPVLATSYENPPSCVWSDVNLPLEE